MLFIGLLCLLIGGLLGLLAWRRLKSWDRFNGTVIGVHEGVRERVDDNRIVFHSVIRYVDAKGKTQKILSDSGENSVDKIHIGATVVIAINPKDESMTATVPALKTIATISLVLFMIGAALSGYGIYNWSAGGVLPLLVGLAFVAAIGWSGFSWIVSFGNDPALRAAARANRQQKLADALAESDELTEIEMSTRVANEALAVEGMKAKAGLIAYPLQIFFGITMLVVAGPWSFDRLFEQYGATQTVGTVVGYGSAVGLFRDGRFTLPGYHAAVEFQTATDGKRTLVDWLGTVRPVYSNGENVPVLYSTNNPGRASIDRGAWDWAPAVVVLLLGIVLIARSLWKLLAVLER